MSAGNQSQNIVLLYKYIEVGGVATYLKTLSKAGIQHKYNMYLVTGADYHNKDFLKGLEKTGLHILPVPFTENKLLLAARFWKVLKKNHRSYHFDVIHSHHRLCHLLGKLFSRRYDIPLLVSVHEFKYDQKLLTNCWKNEHLTVPSKALKKHLKEAYNADSESIHVIPNTIEEQEKIDKGRLKMLKETIFQDRKMLYIGYIGRLAYEKGTDILLESIARINAKNLNIAFRIFGTGPIEKQLKKRGSELGLNADRIFQGVCDEVNEIISLMDICVSPSRTESFSIFVLEAMRAGKPVVASRVGGIPEVVIDGQTGLLIEPENPEKLANILVKLSQNTELRDKLGKKAEEVFNEKFSTARFFQEHQKLYGQLTNTEHG